jgi:hypothetical protein
MNRLEALRKNLADMSPEELREKVRSIRAERKTRKERPATVKKAKVKVEKDKASILKAMDGMNEKQLAALLAELENGSSEHSDQVDQGEGSSEG